MAPAPNNTDSARVAYALQYHRDDVKWLDKEQWKLLLETPRVATRRRQSAGADCLGSPGVRQTITGCPFLALARFGFNDANRVGGVGGGDGSRGGRPRWMQSRKYRISCS